MRLERLGVNKFKIFLTFDDLEERGFSREELWYDFPQAHRLFQEMLFEASEELGIDLDGVILVQVHLLNAQGMLIVVTQDLDYVDDEFIEMKVTLDESKEFIFSFASFESVIGLCHRLHRIGVSGGDIYHMEQQYYMHLDEQQLTRLNREDLIAIMSEYSSPSTVTSIRLQEYGKEIVKRNAIEEVVKYFAS
ncbi:genetic competence negative regulator [Salirhabdus salicampi]|uniref:genetic competence negative regulator n=1 Tax=Salirhabdus salicampi TaxID=476102 RepID=UPI0020C32516|nr:genetic competence negative regulator [Salirhabdus salicampi]MCP8616725.1 genetic competence negative regulator [Salirhabdus salicampi]